MTYISRILRSSLILLLGVVTLAVGGCKSVVGNDESTSTSQPQVERSVPSLNGAELDMLAQVNEFRASAGLAPLREDPAITAQARAHSRNMALGNVEFGHDGFEARARSIRSAIEAYGVSENVAVNKGYDDPVATAVEGLIDSPGHRKNMLGRFDKTGVGIYKASDGRYYFTQIFVESEPALR